jgi:hypothetical protein
MTDLHEDLKSFHRYALMKLEDKGYESLEEILGLWRANHPLRPKPADAKPKRGKAAGQTKSDPANKSGIPYL